MSWVFTFGCYLFIDFLISFLKKSKDKQVPLFLFLHEYFNFTIDFTEHKENAWQIFGQLFLDKVQLFGSWVVGVNID